MAKREPDIPIYSIKKVSELTNVPINTLRSWENRFRLIKPMRTEGGGHRLYTREDIERMRMIKEQD